MAEITDTDHTDQEGSCHGAGQESPNFGFTAEQCHGLLTLLQQYQSQAPLHASNQISTTKPSSSASVQKSHLAGKPSSLPFCSWILDSGATDHICSSLSFFVSYHEIRPIHVQLPNGSNVLASHLGSILISPNFLLHNVLHIPSFAYNLISVTKLTSSITCMLSFDATGCVI